MLDEIKSSLNSPVSLTTGETPVFQPVVDVRANSYVPRRNVLLLDRLAAPVQNRI